METIIDCKEGSSTSRTNPSNSKTVSKFPIDISCVCNTIFLYCDVVQNEILGDTQTALLRIPLSNFLSEHPRQQYLNYQTFTNLQWRRIVKSSIESIPISLRSESGHLLPFLSRGRTNITLQFRHCCESSILVKVITLSGRFMDASCDAHSVLQIHHQ